MYANFDHFKLFGCKNNLINISASVFPPILSFVLSTNRLRNTKIDCHGFTKRSCDDKKVNVTINYNEK